MDHASRFQKLVQFRAPATLSDAIDAAAKRQCQSKSEYIRRSVFDCIKADGIDPAAIAGPQMFDGSSNWPGALKI